ncbi:MAG: serine/threonine-protein kinase [Lachnospiraceae bacterium]|nr:serine/threonine-protein kinase [Lachnospiraceae bacterium]
MDKIYKNRYRVIRPLGSGGQGRVFLVEDLHVDKVWAMKVIEGIHQKKENKIAAELELQALRNLNHKNLPMIVDLIEVGDGVGIIMEYIPGEDLENYIRTKGSLSQEKVVQWGMVLCDVLQYLHTRSPVFLYGDLKPANIIVTKDEEIRLIDMGSVLQEHQIHQYPLLGTYGYMPPERTRDARSDIYSLGVTLHYMLTGSNPVTPGCQLRPVREYNSTLSMGLEKIISRCMEREPNKRYQSCKAVRKDLVNYRLLEQEYIWNYRVACMTYFLLTVNSLAITAVELYRIYANGGECRKGYLIYGMISALIAYGIKKKNINRENVVMGYYRQETSIIKSSALHLVNADFKRQATE